MGNAEVSIGILARVFFEKFVKSRFATVERLSVVRTLQEFYSRHSSPVRFGASSAKFPVSRGSLPEFHSRPRRIGDRFDEQLEVTLGELNAAESGKNLFRFLGESSFG